MNERFTKQDAQLLDELYAGTFCQVYRADPQTPLRVRAQYAGNTVSVDVRDLDEHCQPVTYATTVEANARWIAQQEQDVLRRARAWCAVHRTELH